MEDAAALSIRWPQADGESLDPFRADRIFALDERLTRQFGKTLSMLIKLREMRPAGSTTQHDRHGDPPTQTQEPVQTNRATSDGWVSCRCRSTGYFLLTEDTLENALGSGVDDVLCLIKEHAIAAWIGVALHIELSDYSTGLGVENIDRRR